MVVIRLNNNGDLANSKPCCNCIYYLRLYGIKNIYYSNEKGEIVKEKINEIKTEHASISHARYLEYLENGDIEILNCFDGNYRRRKYSKESYK